MRYSSYQAIVDKQGRVSIPAILRRRYKIKIGDILDVYTHGMAICYRKVDGVQFVTDLIDMICDVFIQEKVTSPDKQRELLDKMEDVRKLAKKVLRE